MRMLRFLAVRAMTMMPILLGLIFVVFMLVRIGSYDATAMLAGPMADAETQAKLAEQFGLNLPIWQQFLIYLNALLHGDLGRSWVSGAPVVDEIAQRLPASLELLCWGVLLISVLLQDGYRAGADGTHLA